MWTVYRLAVAMLHRRIVRVLIASELQRPRKNHSPANRSAADGFQENTFVLEKSFHGFPSIYSSATMHATIQCIIAHSAKSPTLHNVIALIPHGTHRLVESAP
jgi:hypothetical protein